MKKKFLQFLVLPLPCPFLFQWPQRESFPRSNGASVTGKLITPEKRQKEQASGEESGPRVGRVHPKLEP